MKLKKNDIGHDYEKYLKANSTFWAKNEKNDIWCTVVSKKGEFSSYEKTSSNFSLWALRWKYCLPKNIFSYAYVK